MQSRKWSYGLIGVLGVILLFASAAFVFLNLSNSNSNNQRDGSSNESVKIHVRETGLYELDLEDLRSFNKAIDEVSAQTLHLSHQGNPVPYFVDGDALFFYGVEPESRYTPYRPYILSMVEAGLLMDEATVALEEGQRVEIIPDILHLEENHIYDSRSVPSGEQDLEFLDPWFWATIQHEDEIAIEFSLSDVSEDSGGLLRTAFYGATSLGSVDPDHDVSLILNGTHIVTTSWDGESKHIGESLIEPGILRPGMNTLVFDNHRGGQSSESDSSSPSDESSDSWLDIIRLDWIEVEYSRKPVAIDDQVLLGGTSGELNIEGFSDKPWLIDISDPLEPRRVTGWNYDDGVMKLLVSEDSTLLAAGPLGTIRSPAITPINPSNWRDKSMQADLVILTTDELLPRLTPLVEWREAQGLSVVRIPLNDVYNEFGGGEPSPNSIALFVEYALDDWSEPSPSYLLLVGEASYDYKDYLGQIGQNVIPAPMVNVDFGGETVSDAHLGDSDGDGLPDIAIGRWPISTEKETSELVERTIAYEQGIGVDSVLLVADGTSREFASLSDEVLRAGGLPEDSAKRLYGVPADQFTDAWNDGAWLVSYAGHGSIDRWGKDSVFSFEAISDIDTDGSPPIVLQLTCLTGFFAHPSVDSISELMFRHESGPVEIIAATSLTLSSSQRPFGVNFVKALQDPDVIRIGDALQIAKASLDVENSRQLREISQTFTLIGDPSAIIIRPDLGQ